MISIAVVRVVRVAKPPARRRRGSEGGVGGVGGASSSEAAAEEPAADGERLLGELTGDPSSLMSSLSLACRSSVEDDVADWLGCSRASTNCSESSAMRQTREQQQQVERSFEKCKRCGR